MIEDIHRRYRELHDEMIAEFARAAAVERHWLIYTLIGWEHMIACLVTWFLLGDIGLTIKWPYLVVWGVQILAVVLTIHFVTLPTKTDEVPLEHINKRVWGMFIVLACAVAVLNVIAGHSTFILMPMLAVLSSFGFTCMTTVINRRFMTAGVVMVFTGMLMARFPEYGMLIYGIAWLLILQTMGVIFYIKRRKWLQEQVATSSHNPETMQDNGNYPQQVLNIS